MLFKIYSLTYIAFVLRFVYNLLFMYTKYRFIYCSPKNICHSLLYCTPILSIVLNLGILDIIRNILYCTDKVLFSVYFTLIKYRL